MPFHLKVRLGHRLFMLCMKLVRISCNLTGHKCVRGYFVPICVVIRK
jgi:hypothetical protein